MCREPLLTPVVLSMVLGACVVQGGDTEPAQDIIGFVYVCRTDDDATAEWCWNGTAESLVLEVGSEWSCGPTLRHPGPCLYRCPGGRGCNAYDGCFCSDHDP